MIFVIADDDETVFVMMCFYSEIEATSHFLTETDVKLQSLPNLILDRPYGAIPTKQAYFSRFISNTFYNINNNIIILDFLSYFLL